MMECLNHMAGEMDRIDSQEPEKPVTKVKLRRKA
jgi:hypothetical protein